MTDAAVSGVIRVLSFPGILYALGGAAVGYIFGFLPGLTASVALSVLLPLTYGMEADFAIMMCAGVLGGVCFGGSVSAIVLNTPGTGSNAATTLDGYPMSKEGRASEALGASASASFLGHAFGILAIIAVMPLMMRIVLSFGPPEWFALGIGGLSLVASVSGKSLLNGLVAACLGLLLSTHGVNPVVGSPRYTFGLMSLWDGLPLVPVLVGMLALPELVLIFSEHTTISATGKLSGGGTWKGVRATLRNLPLVALCGTIGTLIGAIPGVGGNVSTWIAYSQAKSLSKHPEQFGKGCIEGVIAPEAANDATEGGALMPLLSLGIPGSPSTAVLLGAFITHGLVPGQKLITQQLPTVFALLWAHLLGAFVACTIGLWLAKYAARITVVPTRLLAPLLTIVCLVGCYATRQRAEDLVIAVVFAVLGYAMRRSNIPRVPVLLGLILGPRWSAPTRYPCSFRTVLLRYSSRGRIRCSSC
ncbi:MAG: tripartite tricarboxylate transporter permease [Firmicutes bacterium]|nr:tripartite tricarboxylate transporter permease [Bacillota bacterium]